MPGNHCCSASIGVERGQRSCPRRKRRRTSMTGTLTTSGVDHADVADLRREIAQLRDKLATQPVIEQAKGMLMQTFGMDSAGAFDILRVMSQNCNVKVRSVAMFIVESWTRDGPRA